MSKIPKAPSPLGAALYTERSLRVKAAAPAASAAHFSRAQAPSVGSSVVLLRSAQFEESCQSGSQKKEPDIEADHLGVGRPVGERRHLIGRTADQHGKFERVLSGI